MKDIIDIENRSNNSRYLNEPCGIFENRCYILANHLIIDKNKRKKTIYDLQEDTSSNDVVVEEILL